MEAAFSRIFFFILVLGLVPIRGNADLVEDKRALINFITLLRPSRLLGWNTSTSVCNHWTGVTCDNNRTRVVAVRLPGVGFEGPIPPDTLSRLSSLEVLSLRSNGINGAFPSDFVKLRNLTFLYLQFNNFSGPLPLNFSFWKNLTVLNLSNNGFNGGIPSSLADLTQLQSLNLANNSLSGEIPHSNFSHLQQINLSNNNLTGEIPKSLSNFPNWSFSGNSLTLTTPNTNSPSPLKPSSPTPNQNSKMPFGLNELVFILIVVGACVFGLIAFAFSILVCCLRRKTEHSLSGKLQKSKMSPEKEVSRNEDESNRVFFFEGCNYVFDLEDLLRASAEVLGKGTFGTTYKANLEDLTTVVVKRLKEVGVGKKDFEQQMEIVGNIKHDNVVELKAYYYSKDEKLVVYDYNNHGSISSMLHGNRGEDKSELDWDTRMRIAIGAARGIAHLHSETNRKLVHGNVKSSNIFLNSQQYGCVSDFGLTAIMSPLTPPISRAAGYRAPEVTDTRKSSQPSDVFSFGVVLLELLTGKSPIHTTSGDEIIHLVRWVHSVVREEWTGEVFDVKLLRYPNIEEEMVEMLQIAMACVTKVPDQRPKMIDVVKMIENVRPKDGNKIESSSPPPGNGTEIGSSN